MAVFTTPRPSPLHAPTQAFPARLPLDDPVSTACLGPLVGKSEKGEGPRAPRRWVATWWPLERSQPRLFGMHGPAETGKPPREDCPHPAGVGFQREADDTIIGKTRDKAPAVHPGGARLGQPIRPRPDAGIPSTPWARSLRLVAPLGPGTSGLPTPARQHGATCQAVSLCPPH
jgi:hypothetical protein